MNLCCPAVAPAFMLIARQASPGEFASSICWLLASKAVASIRDMPFASTSVRLWEEGAPQGLKELGGAPGNGLCPSPSATSSTYPINRSSNEAEIAIIDDKQQSNALGEVMESYTEGARLRSVPPSPAPVQHAVVALPLLETLYAHAYCR